MRNRWFIAAAAVGLHLSIGSIYAYSVFSKPLSDALGWTATDVAWAFSVAIVFLGLAASFLGPRVQRMGPRRSGLLSMALFTTGLAFSSAAVHFAWLPLFYLGYGVIAGAGIGIGYITPLGTLISWFPDRRGLATGLAIMGFGFGALLAGSLAGILLPKIGLTGTFGAMAAIYGVIMFCSARQLVPPPPGWEPPPSDVKKANPSRGSSVPLPEIDSFAALRTLRFYLLWLMMFLNVTCGIALISVASPMSQEVADLSVSSAAAMVGLMGLFNGLGRLAWASLSDFFGRPLIFSTFFVLQILAFVLLPQATQALLFQAIVFIIISCYGGGFATMPAYVGDLFGTRHLAAIYGNILTAWAAAGVAGPLIAAGVREATGSYLGMLGVFVLLLGLGLVCSLILTVLSRRRPSRQVAA